MCTVSWLRQTDGYELFFNRDELRTRRPAQPPAPREQAGVRYLAPTDGDKGGTWLGVNEYGLAVGVLNRYQDPFDRAQDYDSRGWLVRDRMACRNPDDVANKLAQQDLTRFPPFTLLALAPGRAAFIVHWNGQKLWLEPDADALMPLSSSSYRAPEVIAARREQFRELAASNKLTSEFLRRFHHSHAPAAGPFAVCMHRDDAQTVSFSHVKVGAKRIEFAYQPGPPCAETTAEIMSLPVAV
jgi:uncharacterized protein with NRDE domain